METAALRAALWSAPVAAPTGEPGAKGPDLPGQGPAHELADDIRRGADYVPVLDRLRALSLHGLPVAPALDPALARWDWSIDLALVAVEAGLPGGLETLRNRVLGQRRRHGALGQALWAAGQPDAALALLADTDPDCETWVDDQITRAELAMNRPDPALARAVLDPLLPRLDPGPAARLRLMALWLAQGASALARAAQDPLPDHPAPWSLLWEAWLIERDLPRARAALARLTALRAPGDAETQLDHIRLALECEDPEAARDRLAALPAIPPADWPQRRHALHLRALLGAGDLRGDPALWHAGRVHALRAQRLYPRNAVLAGLALALRERLEDWDDLAMDLRQGLTRHLAQGDPGTPAGSVTASVTTLARLGLPDPDRLPPSGVPEVAAERARLRADLCLQSGDPGAALSAADSPDLPSHAAVVRDEWRIEALLWDRDIPAAAALLDRALTAHPSRPGLILQRARARFFLGDFAGAEGALAEFRRAKTDQTGLPPPEDLRDRITDSARLSGASLPLDEGATASAARLGPMLAAHPGLAACWLARPGAVPALAAVPDGAIPRRLSLYWQGAVPAPVARGVRAWRDALPGWNMVLHDADSARRWLAGHDPDALAPFDALTSPAARADLFRACLLAREGGLYVDSDEYPRADVTPWLAGADAVVVLESGYGTVANNFLAVRPGHPLMAGLRSRILARLSQTQAPYPWWDTGPAQLTGALAALLTSSPAGGPPGLRVLAQAEYCARVTTNLPFPHKRLPGHWRQGLSRPPGRGQIAT